VILSDSLPPNSMRNDLRASACADLADGSSVPDQGSRKNGQGGTLARRRYQLGTLRLRGKRTKVWTLRWREDIVESDGRIRRVKREAVIGTHADFPTQKLARRRADIFLSRVNRPDYRPGKIIGFEDFSERWKEHALSQQKPSGQRVAESHLRTHLVPRFKAMRLDQIGQEDVQALVTVLGRTLGQHTILNVVGTLFAILKMARKWGYVVNDVRMADLVVSHAKPGREGRFFTAEQAVAILGRATEPWRTIFAVAAMTGLRPGEVLGLSVDDLDFDRRLINVNRSAWYTELVTTKTKSSKKPVPMPEPLERIIRAHLATWKPNERKLLFATSRGNPYSRNKVVQTRLWPILDELKIPRCGMHAFRHMFATTALELGASPKTVQEQLRHSDVSITMSKYVHSIEEAQRKSAENVAMILDGNGRNSTAKSSYVN
jgi:integrase